MSDMSYEEIQADACFRIISIDEDELMQLAEELGLLDEEDI